jgi:3-deoxy-D-manno-octulosonate 8-phosphate phosphatase KdsC-like HAD superfamily phosphatase
LNQSSTYDNEKNLPDDYIDSLKNDYPPQLIEAYLNGQFVNLTSGSVYQNYDPQAHRSKEHVRDGEPLYVGMDFNVTKMAAVIYVQRNGGKEWHAVDEIKNGYDTPEVIQILQERYPKNEITVYPDASGKNRKTIGASTSDIAMLKGAGFNIMAKQANPLVKDRVLSVNAAFHKGILFVNDKSCPETAECLQQQVYDDNGQPDKKGGKDHQNDAAGYPIAYEFPIRKPVIHVPVNF